MGQRGPKVNDDIAVAVLLEALFTTDEEACSKYQIHRRTLANYRKRLAEDKNFAQFFLTKKKEFYDKWADDMPVALKDSLAFISHASRSAAKDPRSYMNPALISAVAGAMKLVADILYTGWVIDARITDTNRQETGISQSDSAEADSAYIS